MAGKDGAAVEVLGLNQEGDGTFDPKRYIDCGREESWSEDFDAWDETEWEK